MMPPPANVLSHVVAVLSDQVLPELPPSDWLAANVRACISLLTYVQDAIAAGQENLATERGAILALIDKLAGADEPWFDAKLRAQLGLAVDEAKANAPSHDANERYKELLSCIVTQSVGRRTPEFEEWLRACLAVVNEAEFAPLTRASKLMPF